MLANVLQEPTTTFKPIVKVNLYNIIKTAFLYVIFVPMAQAV